MRVEGTDTHAYDTPGPGLVRSVTLSDSILVFHEGYWLAPDEYVTHKEWLAEMRAERARRRAYFGMNDRVYTGAYAWTARNFVQAFVYVFDTRFYDVRKGRYLLDEYLADGRRRFGGYDSLLLWHSYTNIGVDPQNQFQMLRSLPGGLPELKKLIDRGHQQGVRTYIAYNPWDWATTQEKVPHIDSLADTVKQIEADGIFLDVTQNTPHDKLRAAVDRVRPGVVLEPEGSVPPFDAGNATINASWGQGYPTACYIDHARGVPIEKWSEPRHTIHFDGDRWRHDRTAMFQHAFLNGTGVVIWEDIFGSWNSYTERDQAMLRRMVPIERHFADLLASQGWEPFYPTLAKNVDASCWPGTDRALWTIVNWSPEPAAGEILRVEHVAGTRYFDVWNGIEIEPTVHDGQATLKISAIEGHGLAAIVALKTAPDAAFEKLLADCRTRAARKLADYSDEWQPPAPPVLHLPGKTALARANDPPENMALVPVTERFTMAVIHNLGEACCYPDDNRPEWYRRWSYMYEHGAHLRNIMHNIVVPRISAFFMDKYLVTNAQYQTFLEKSGYRPADAANFLKHWDWSDREHPMPPKGRENHPVVWVASEDARAYAAWAGKRLPTEEEWQYAAGGANHLRYPWGNQWKPGVANDRGQGTTAVDAFPAGRSPFGLFDMSGNVWQWNESEARRRQPLRRPARRLVLSGRRLGLVFRPLRPVRPRPRRMVRPAHELSHKTLPHVPQHRPQGDHRFSVCEGCGRIGGRIEGISMDTERWISLAAAAAFCIFAVWLQPWHLIYAAIAYMVLPLAAIWYGDELGEYTSGWHINMPTPGVMVKILGWILLTLTPLAVYTLKLRLELTR